MPDRVEKLKSTLRELEAELASLDSLDEETRAALQSAVDEISQRLRKREYQPQQADSLATRLQDAAGEFETSHPTLFGIVTRTIDALGQMGI
jgi:chromosome segregation ATPase